MVLAFGLPARADVIFQLNLPLTSQNDTQTVVNTYGGQISGGQFGPNGWTTLTRADFIEIYLPPQLATQEGMLAVTVGDFEMNPPFTTHYWGFELVAIDPFGAQASSLPPTGRAHLASGYRGYWDAGNDYVAQAFWNLFDPSCTDWHNCTTETGSGGSFITGAAPVTWTHVWTGQAQEVWFEGNTTVHRVMDLAATSPNGQFYEDLLILTVNVCGGSSQLVCGSWDEPANRGGPIGVTYSDLTLEIYGVLPADAGVAPDGSAGIDAGPTDAVPVAPDAPVTPDAGPPPDGRADDAQAAEADSGGPADMSGGCGSCRAAGSGRHAALPLWLFVGLLVSRRISRRRYSSSRWAR